MKFIIEICLYFCLQVIIVSSFQTPTPNRNGLKALKLSSLDTNESKTFQTQNSITRKDFISGFATGLGVTFSIGSFSPQAFAEDVPTTGFITKSGLKCYDIQVGTGKRPEWGQVLSYHYKLSIRSSGSEDLQKIDSTYDRKQAFLDKHGNGRMIVGLDEGIHTMRVGGKRRIIIPPNLGYVSSGTGPIPPGPLQRKSFNKKLSNMQNDGQIVFDVELLMAYDDEADLGYYRDESYTFEQVQEASRLAKKGLAPSFKVY